MSSENKDQTSPVLCSKADGVLEITFNRPEVLNAWNEAMVPALLQALQSAWQDDEVRAILITGAGNSYSVGGDIDFLEKINKDPNLSIKEVIGTYGTLMRTMIEMEKPIISAINGHVVGGATGVVMVSDVTLMSDKARILCGGQLNIGMVPGDAPFSWPFLCSMSQLKYRMFASDFISAADAERIGLVSAMVPHDELMTHARAYARKLASRDPSSLGLTKKALNSWYRQGYPILDLSLAMEAVAFVRPEIVGMIDDMRKVIS